MDKERINAIFSLCFPDRITTIDSHTAGESTRLIVDGLPPIQGRDMKEKLDYFREHLDHVRLSLTREPRGNNELAAVVTEPVNPGSAFGLLYMDARRYPFLCGHATIGAVATLLETCVIPPEGHEMEIIVDTPSGPMKTRARMEDGRVASVTICMVPSFVYGADEKLEVPGLGTITVDTVCVGGFFVMVSAEQTKMELVPENRPALIKLGMEIIDAANRQLTVKHPERPEVSTVDVVEFYAPLDGRANHGKSIVVYGESHVDRSPCGTGTAAKLTLLHRRGEFKTGETFVNEGPLKTTFEARIAGERDIKNFKAVEVEITGSAHITGIHDFVIQDSDPLAKGFLL